MREPKNHESATAWVANETTRELQKLQELNIFATILATSVAKAALSTHVKKADTMSYLLVSVMGIRHATNSSVDLQQGLQNVVN